MKKFILIIVFAFIAVVCSAQYRDEYKSIASEPATLEQVVAMPNFGSFTPIDLDASIKAQKDILWGKTLVLVGVGAGIAISVFYDDIPPIFSYPIYVASATTIIIGVVKWCRGEKAVKRLSATSGGLAFNF